MSDSTTQEPPQTISLFDSLARLVPEELQREYYRVVAHVETLGPEDEMLRILEAMGVLALIVRQTPREIAEEREQMRNLLEQYLQSTKQTQAGVIEFGKDIDSRLSKLPKEIELGLNPTRIAGLLGESLRQHLAATGMKETIVSLEQTVVQMRTVQATLTSTLRSVADPNYGIASRVEETNRRVFQSVETRAARVDEFLMEMRSDLLRIWFPIVASACLVLGIAVGVSLQSWRDSNQKSCMSSATPPQEFQHHQSMPLLQRPDERTALSSAHLTLKGDPMPQTMSSASSSVLEPDGNYLTAKEASKIVRVHYVTLLRWAREDKVPHRRLSTRKIVFSRTQLNTWLESGYNGSTVRAA
jgi:excisionase family DNA binding protein